MKTLFVSAGCVTSRLKKFSTSAITVLRFAAVVIVSNGKAIISFQNLGFYGTGTETFDFWFGIDAVASNTSRSVSLTVDVTGHSPNPVLIGHSYSGEATFQIVAQPNGLLTVSDTAF